MSPWLAVQLVLTTVVLIIGNAVAAPNCNSVAPVEVPGLSQNLSSPGYPADYPISKDCLYNVTVPAGHTIKLTFIEFRLEDGSNRVCDADYVEVFDAASSDVASNQVCGSQIPPPFYSKTNWMKVKFHSDGANGYKGFTTVATAITENNICPSNAVLTDSQGIIESPFYPRNYPGNKQCEWHITAPKGKHINFTFVDFRVEKCGYPGVCACDFVEVRKGFSSLANEMGKLCQNGLSVGDKNLGNSIFSIHNTMLVKFKSNDDQSNHYKGFKAYYQQIDFTPPVCPDVPINFTDANGTLSSPNYPRQNYPSNVHCMWHITVASGLRVKINFTDFKIEGPGCAAFPDMIKCRCDFLRIFDGDSTGDAVLAELCGFTVPSPVVSSGNNMLVEFRSGSATEYKGFHAVYITTDDAPSPTIIQPRSTPTQPTPTSKSSTFCPPCSRGALMALGMLIAILGQALVVNNKL